MKTSAQNSSFSLRKLSYRLIKIGVLLLILFISGVIVFMQFPRFGKHPKGDRLARVEQSPNYKNGEFQNLSPTPMMTEGVSYWSMIVEYVTTRKKLPQSPLPTIKTNILELNPEENVLIWMGHSSYFIQIDGKKILVDPVLSGFASPVSFSTRAFAGSDIYTTKEIPEIDYLFISHDHYDHMDHSTLLKLIPKVNTVICGLGIGAHLEYWGFDPSVIKERDWNSTLAFDDGFTVHVTPARHFSGRGLKRNQSLWASYVLKAPSLTIYIGGDSGYDTHFKEIRDRFGSVDLAILENGQYDEAWKYTHMMPQEVIQATKDLQASTLFPVHSGKFSLANHDWDEPLRRITELSAESPFRLITPKIGEIVNLMDSTQTFSEWWTNVE